MDEEISKKERIRIKHELERSSVEKGEKNKRLFLWGSGFIIITIVGFLGFVFLQNPKVAEKPKPGRQIADLGRQHVADISDVTYNSNPPTSGPHFSVWAKRGAYSDVISDGHLIHSLEHGYVILSYNCATKDEQEKFVSDYLGLFKVAKLKADGKMTAFTPDNPPAQEIELPASFFSNDCKKLADQLSMFIKEFDRVIIVPRPQMDNMIAVTAWTRIDTMDQFDEERIKSFIKAFHNAGPEKTLE